MIWHTSLVIHGMIQALVQQHEKKRADTDGMMRVADAIARVALQVGGQVRREVEGLDPNSKQRPDLQIAFPGRLLLTDVVVSHTLELA